MDVLLMVMLYINVTLAIANTIIYWIASRRAAKQFRLLKRMMSLIMLTTVLVYIQLAIPGEFLSAPSADAILVRLNFSALLIVLFLSGLIGMVGERGQIH